MSCIIMMHADVQPEAGAIIILLFEYSALLTGLILEVLTISQFLLETRY